MSPSSDSSRQSSRGSSCVIKSMYTSLVLSKDDLWSEVSQDHLSTMSDIIRNDLSDDDVKYLLAIKIKEDRLNHDGYITSKDRSRINREIQLGHIRIRNFLFISMITTIAIIMLLFTSYFFIDLHSFLSREGVHFYNYKKILEDFYDGM